MKLKKYEFQSRYDNNLQKGFPQHNRQEKLRFTRQQLGDVESRIFTQRDTPQSSVGAALIWRETN